MLERQMLPNLFCRPTRTKKKNLVSQKIRPMTNLQLFIFMSHATRETTRHLYLFSCEKSMGMSAPTKESSTSTGARMRSPNLRVSFHKLSEVFVQLLCSAWLRMNSDADQVKRGHAHSFLRQGPDLSWIWSRNYEPVGGCPFFLIRRRRRRADI